MSTPNSFKTTASADPAWETARETSALWHDLLNRDKVSEESRAAFQSWLEQSPDNRTAYEAIDRAWSLVQTKPHDPQILALRHETALRLTRKSTLATRPIRWAAAAVVLVAIGAALLATFRPELGTVTAPSTRERSPLQNFIQTLRSGEHYVTATGERLTVALTDGSQVTLNTQSELKVAFEPGERKVSLTRGQALFEVAKDKTRPFVVEAQGRRFIAVGTAFDVRIDLDRVQVTMIEGTVKVDSTSPLHVREEGGRRPGEVSRTDRDLSGSNEILLTAGQQFIANSQTETNNIRTANAERVTSWRIGQAIFEDSRLVDAVAELNRYSKTQITLADPALANLRISGAFLTGRPGNFVEALTHYFPIQAQRHTDGDIVLTAR